MSPLFQLLLALVRALLPGILAALAKRACQGETMEEGARRPRLRQALQRRIRATWGAALALLIVPGCAVPRTVYVPAGEPVRLRETIPDAKVWVVDAGGQPVPVTMDLPEGWYCLEAPAEEDHGR
jgi:hypothetical protein